MYCVKIEKVLKKLEYETIAWLVIGVVHHLNTLCGEDKKEGKIVSHQLGVSTGYGDAHQ